MINLYIIIILNILINDIVVYYTTQICIYFLLILIVRACLAYIDRYENWLVACIKKSLEHNRTKI